MSIFSETHGLEEEDPILSLGVFFRQDARPNKVNLGIGAYKSAEGDPTVLSCVRKAERWIQEQLLDKEYLPIEGDAAFLHQTLPLVLGGGTQRSAIIQTIGATSALRLGGDYLAIQGPRSIYVSDPSWSNHRTLFSRSGLTVHTYPYFDPATGVLNFDAMCGAIAKMPAGSGILLHGCGHNPTGVDPTIDQWKELSALIQKANLFPFFDLAYQGFAQGLDADAFGPRYFSEQGHTCFIAYSFSKNLGLYGERVGALIAVCDDGATAAKVERQLKSLVRGAYSTPPLHGGRVVSTVLRSPELRSEWQEELVSMRQRIQDMRQTLVERLQRSQQRDLAFLRRQHGLFSFGLLKSEHVQILRKDYAIYLPNNGRINVAGLNAHNLDYVVQAIESVMGR